MIKAEYIDKINQWSEKYKDNRHYKHWDKFLKLNPEIDLYVSELIENKPWFARKITAITLLSRGIYDVKKCGVCKKTMDVKKVIKGKKYCSRKCSSESKERKEKNRQTCMRRYGVDNGAKTNASKEKVKQTCLKKYGVENHNKLSSVRKKIKKTCLERFGSSTPAGNPNVVKKMKKTKLKNHGTLNNWDCREIKDKIISTNRKRYGTDHASQSKEFRESVKNTCLKKYGVESTLASDRVRKKIKKTLISRYGVDNPLKNKDIRKKVEQTCLERYGVAHYAQSQASKDMIRANTYNNFARWNKYVIALFGVADYNGYDKTYRWQCVRCNSEFEQKILRTCHVKNDQLVPRCLNCFPYVEGFSQSEKNLVEFIKSIYSGEIVEGDRTILNPFELDIYLPDKKVAIEFNGLYWHSEGQGKDRNYHLDKTKECKKQGIQLIHIFEDEWVEKQDIVKSRIKSILGIYDKRVYARNCEIKELDSKTCNDFLQHNHLQGKDRGSIRYGLYFDNELVSVMTFGKPRFNRKYDYEMIRFCSKLGYQIIGGASKLLKHFQRNHKGSIVSYADKRYSDGKLYEMLGFKLKHISSPNYWWTRGNIKLSRYQCQKHKLKNVLGDGFNPDLSETENMMLNGYDKIYDCGNLVFGKII